MKIVKTTIGLLSAGSSALKKLASVLLSIPKGALKILIRIQMEIVYLPIRLLNGICNTVFKSEQITRCNGSTFVISPQKECTSKEEDIIKEVKDIRNITLRAIASATSKDFMLQSKQMKEETDKRLKELCSLTCQKADVVKGVSKAIQCLDNAKVREELNNEINTENETTVGESRVITDALNILEERDASTREEFKNIIEEKNAEKEIVSFLSSYKPSFPKGETPISNDKQAFSSSISILQTLAKVSIKENILLRRRLCLTNNKFEDVLDSFNCLVGELSKLNKQLKKLTTLTSKMTSLQMELNEGKKLLQEVEEDRNQMFDKLQTLRRMIKEEEEYLNDVSLERGMSEFHILKCLEKRSK